MGESLANDSYATCSQRYTHSQLGSTSGAAGQQQVGNVRTGDEQHHAGKKHEHAEALAGLLLQSLDAAASGGKNYVLARNLRCAAVSGIRGMRKHPLA